MRSTAGAKVAFVVAIVAGIGLLVLYVAGGQTQLEGLLWFYALGAFGFGIVMASNTVFRTGETEEERHVLASSDEEIAEVREALATPHSEDDAADKEKRSMIRFIVGSFVAFGAAVVLPIRSLGPRPTEDLRETDFAEGVRLVTVDGAPVSEKQLSVGEVITVFPEGHTSAADSPTLLIKYDEEKFVPLPQREDWIAGGLVAYSKICTHAACGVGLYQNVTGYLLCPCHQSTFDVNHGCEPRFGPATRALPQLPIAIDAEGFVVAASDYTEPVGPGFWDRMAGA